MIILEFSDENGASQMLGPDVYGVRFFVQRISTYGLVYGKRCTCDRRERFRATSDCARHPIAHTFYWLRSEAGEDIGAAVVGLDNANALVTGRLELGREA